MPEFFQVRCGGHLLLCAELFWVLECRNVGFLFQSNTTTVDMMLVQVCKLSSYQKCDPHCRNTTLTTIIRLLLYKTKKKIICCLLLMVMIILSLFTHFHVIVVLCGGPALWKTTDYVCHNVYAVHFHKMENIFHKKKNICMTPVLV